MKRIIIIGATSGIGMEVAKIYAKSSDYVLGLAGRRIESLNALHDSAPERIFTEKIDVTSPDAADALSRLIAKTGGMDVLLHCSGIGSQNISLQPQIELATAQTNVEGFTRIITAAFAYFKQHSGGHIAAISSIAGTKGLGSAPAYSATKRFQNTYIDALAQLSRMEHLNIRFTDIRPGFVATALLKNGNYPMLMHSDCVARHIVKAIAHGKRRIIIDWRYAILVFFWRLIPAWLWERLPIRND